MDTAVKYLEQRFLWNSGNFVYRADVLLKELDRFAPEVLRAARAAVEKATTDLGFVRLERESFEDAPKTSIDFAVMENTTKAGVLPVNFGWSDIGSWAALWKASPQDEKGNSTRGPVELVATENSLVRSDGMLTTVVGLRNVVVVTTPDAVLVTSLDASERVKELVGSLGAQGRAEAVQHLRNYRPWGWYERRDSGDRFQVKRIMVIPGGRLSLQKHFHRAEHWIVVHGTAEVTIGSEVRIVHENEAVYIPIGSLHRLVNPGRVPLHLVEVQVGSYTGEDDIVRVEDVYGRS